MSDYISREAAIQEFATCGSVFVHGKKGCMAIISRLQQIPPANVRPVVRGHWVWNQNGMDWGLGAWCCDQCRIKAETWWANDQRNNPLRCSGGRFCGNCGADMRPEPPEREVEA